MTTHSIPDRPDPVIAWAAIKKVNDVSGIIYTGASHALIAYHNEWLRGSTPLIAGFMTIHGKFVTRNEAAMYANLDHKYAMAKDFPHLRIQRAIEEETIRWMGHWDRYTNLKDQFKKTLDGSYRRIY